jgi:voltage-gated potassium channel
MTLLRFLVLLVLSPTRLIIELLKQRSRDAGRLLQCWNLSFFAFELAVCVVLALLMLAPAQIPTPLRAVFVWLAFSRCNEVVYAFYADAIDKLEGKKPATPLTAAQRIPMAMRSFWGLTANFAFICYGWPSLYSPAPQDFVQAFFFSGVTIATLGISDIKPMHAISQLLAVYEVFGGILILVLAIGVYLAGLNKPNA